MRVMKGYGSLERQMDAAGRAIAEGARDARLFAFVHAHEPSMRAAVDALIEHSGRLIDACDAAYTPQVLADRGFRNPLDRSVESEIDMRPDAIFSNSRAKHDSGDLFLRGAGWRAQALPLLPTHLIAAVP